MFFQYLIQAIQYVDAMSPDNLMIIFLAVEFGINMLIRSQQSFLISRFIEQDPLKKRKKIDTEQIM